MAGRFAVESAKQVAKILGARAGAGALRAILDDLGDHEDSGLRRQAHLDFVDLAIEVDEATFDDATRRWSALPAGEAFAEVSARARAWMARGKVREACALADAECVRCPADGRAFYLRARLRGDREEDLVRAAKLAERAGEGDLEQAARARLCRVTGERPLRPIDASALSPRLRLFVFTAQLRAKGRYARVAALDGLCALASSSDVEVAHAAIRVCARHADEDARLTPIEIDRIRTALAHWPEASARELALGRLAAREGLGAGVVEEPETAAQQRRARLVLESGTAGPPPGTPTVTWRALDAIAALRRGEIDVVERVSTICFAIDASRMAPSAPLLTLAWMACGARDVALKAAGEALAARVVTMPGARPATGWLRLSERVADVALAEKLRETALAHREHGAAERVAENRVRRAWKGLEEGGEDEVLLGWLREAKRRAAEA